jgi:hypothetical protein
VSVSYGVSLGIFPRDMAIAPTAEQNIFVATSPEKENVTNAVERRCGRGCHKPVIQGIQKIC